METLSRAQLAEKGDVQEASNLAQFVQISFSLPPPSLPAAPAGFVVDRDRGCRSPVSPPPPVHVRLREARAGRVRLPGGSRGPRCDRAARLAQARRRSPDRERPSLGGGASDRWCFPGLEPMISA